MREIKIVFFSQALNEWPEEVEFDSADVYGGVVSNSTNNNETLEKENEVRYRGQTRHFLFCTFIIKN